MRITPLLVVFVGLTACVDLNSSPTTTGKAFPSIITQPASQSVVAGAAATFSVVASGDSLTYQWYKGTGPITGATSTTYTIPATGIGDAALYQVVVTNSAAAIASDTARLTVVVPQTIVAYRLVGGSASTTNQGYSSIKSDESAIFVGSAGDLTLVNPTITKSGNGTSTSGTNAAMRVESAGHVLMTSGTISTDSAGAIALSATGQGSSIELFRGAITTTSASADGMLAALGASIRVERTPIRAASGVIARATGSSVVTLLINGDTLSGGLIADASSTITATLQGATKLTGAVQGAALSIDGTSTWVVTANSALTTLTLPAGTAGATIPNIVGNGFTVFYTASLPGNAALGGATYTLAGGGQLVPR